MKQTTQPAQPQPQRRQTGQSWAAGALALAKRESKVAKDVCNRFPSTWIVPLILCILMLALSVGVVQYSATQSTKTAKDDASHEAKQSAAEYIKQTEEVHAVLATLTNLVYLQPFYPGMNRSFQAMVPTMYSQVSNGLLTYLQLAPNGIIGNIWPASGASYIGMDIMNGTSDRNILMQAITTRRTILEGPAVFSDGGFSVRIHVPVFVRNVSAEETFGAPPARFNCTETLGCYNATTRTKFWGFVQAHLDLNSVANPRVSDLKRRGFDFSLMVVGMDNTSHTVMATDDLPRNPIVVYYNMTTGSWMLYMAPHNGWRPRWAAPVTAAVVVASLLLSVILFAFMVARRQHQMVLEALLPRNIIRDLRSEGLGSLHQMVPHPHGGTPANVMLSILQDLMEGQEASIQDVTMARTALLKGMNVYQPYNLTKELKEANLDSDVARALMRQLGQSTALDMDGGDIGAAIRSSALILTAADASSNSEALGSSSAAIMATADDPNFASLQGALAAIIGGGLLLATAMGPQCQGHEPLVPSLTQDLDDALDSTLCSLQQPSGLGGPTDAARTATQLHLHSFNSISCIGNNNSSANTPAGLPAGCTPQHLHVIAAAPISSGTGNALGNAHGGGGSGGGGITNHSGSFMQVPSAVMAAVALAGGSSTGPQLVQPQSPISHLSKRLRLKPGAMSNSPSRSTLQCAGSIGDSTSSTSHLQPHQLQELAAHSPRSAACQYSQQGTSQLGQHAAMMAPPPAPPLAMLDEVESLLARVDDWQFDTFKLAEASGGCPLAVLAYFLMSRAGLMTRFKANGKVIARFLTKMEAGYRPNPYHSSTHAADVLHSLHVLLHRSGMVPLYADSTTLLACYIAAVIHDYNHFGVTNDFLITTQDPLALRYNDRSPLENHHCAASYAAAAEVGLFDNMSRSDTISLRKQVIDLVMATDMKQHFSTVTQFTAITAAKGGGKDTPVSTTAGATGAGAGVTSGSRANSENFDGSVHGNGAAAGDTGLHGAAAAAQARPPQDEAERVLSLQVALKCADLGHLAAELAVHQRWVGCLEEEFFLQGDQERSRGLPISPLFDRTKPGVTASQVGFFDFVALPLFRAFAKAFPGAKPMLANVNSNYAYWQACEQAARKSPSADL